MRDHDCTNYARIDDIVPGHREINCITEIPGNRVIWCRACLYRAIDDAESRTVAAIAEWLEEKAKESPGKPDCDWTRAFRWATEMVRSGAWKEPTL